MKYNKYIELSENYESVVDIESEKRNPNLWQEYIVHDDMKNFINALCQTMLWEDNDKRRSFWIHGAYGTGKSYAAIVVKHLLEDSLAEITPFLSRPSLAEHKKRFMRIREKGDFLVVWKSGATDIKSGTHLMMEMEVKIKEKLLEKFGDSAYLGSSSLINAAADAINDRSINWDFLFDDFKYGLSDQYSNFEEFKQVVLSGNSDAINKVKEICDDNNRAMFSGVVERFEDWIKDIIAGNNLQDTGIFFIWDEFTGFLRDCGDDNVLQRLSEFCKSVDKDGNAKQTAPFFLCLIVHRDPTWVSELGDETYERILHRYHELQFHITESAAYDLIGDSIIPRPGMEYQWDDIKKELLKSIAKYKTEFDNLEQGVNLNERLEKLCPIHPMTLAMLATVAEHFGASQRTLFRFMKDQTEASEGVGFSHFINNNEPYRWQWLTTDFLWDYFFTRESDIRNFSVETQKVIQHFQTQKEKISDEYALHVFKAALLLIAVMSGSSISNLYSKQNFSKKLGATRETLYKCFRGQLGEIEIDTYLESFKNIGLLSYSELQNGDLRLELPYSGSSDIFDIRLNQTKKNYSRYKLFSNKGIFSKRLEKGMWDSTKATFGRVYIAACSSETSSINARLGEVKEEISKYAYKMGILVVVISEAKEFASLQTKIKHLSHEDDSGRLVIAMLREPCSEDTLNHWCKAITHMELSKEEGKTGDASRYEIEADTIIATWASSAVESQIFSCYGGVPFTGIFGKGDLAKRIEKDVLYKVFPAAPELIVTVNTAYKRCTESAVLVGLTKELSKNQQISNIVNALKAVDSWDVNDFEDMKNLSGSDVAPIRDLAYFFERHFTQGAKIPLDMLWAELQQAPFGYYNSLVVGCFIGVAMRNLINGPFSWFDGVNTCLPTTENLASMVTKMLDGKAINNNLSSGSEIWHKFKKYIQKIFELADSEVVSETEARKYIKQRVTGFGVPLWALKYISKERFGGEETHNIVVKLIDLFNEFIFETTDNQETVMSDVLTLFNGRGFLRKDIVTIMNNKSLMLEAFRTFIFSKTEGIKVLTEKLALTDKELFDAMRNHLQESIVDWQEDQLLEILDELVLEFRLIEIVKSKTSVDAKTYLSVQNIFRNVFEHMKIPGSVLEKLSMDWVPALKEMRKISLYPWSDFAEKNRVLETLEEYFETVWGYLQQPRVLLEIILKTKNTNVSQKEFDEIYSGLTWYEYETPPSTFEYKFKELLEKVEYNRDVQRIKSMWVERTRTDSISEWCNSVDVPIIWLFDEQAVSALRIIKDLQEEKLVSTEALGNALSFLKSAKVERLGDPLLITDSFFANIGEGYREAFNKEREVLIAKLKTDSELTSDVYSWGNKIPEIRRVLDEHLAERYQVIIAEHINKMSHDDLKMKVLQILNENPELYSMFLTQE